MNWLQGKTSARQHRLMRRLEGAIILPWNWNAPSVCVIRGKAKSLRTHLGFSNQRQKETNVAKWLHIEHRRSLLIVMSKAMVSNKLLQMEKLNEVTVTRFSQKFRLRQATFLSMRST